MTRLIGANSAEYPKAPFVVHLSIPIVNMIQTLTQTQHTTFHPPNLLGNPDPTNEVGSG